jgi:hypothetical protein
MQVTVIKGPLPDRVIVGFWIGGNMQSVIMSYTELECFLGQDDMKIIMDTPIGIWKAKCSIALQV